MSNLRRIHVRWLGDYRTEISVRGVHTISGDEIPQYGSCSWPGWLPACVWRSRT